MIQLIMINLFCILEKYVGIYGNALKLIKSYFLIVLNVLKLMMFSQLLLSIICGVPQGSVLGRLKLYLYLLPLSAILKYHKIGYHI